MPIYEVPAEKWKPFCRAFARDHAGEQVSVEISNRPLGALGTVDERIQYPHAAFLDIAVDGADSTRPSVTIAVVENSSRRVHHQIRAVRIIRLEQPEPVDTACGQILFEGEDGTSLRLMLSDPVVKGMLDGV